VFNISNMHLDLQPVVRALGAKHGMTTFLAPPRPVDPHQGKLPSLWMVLSRNPDFLKRPNIELLLRQPFNAANSKRLLWTDDYSSILPILR
jgi:hypothetical protein